MISVEQAILNLAVALGLSAASGFAADSSSPGSSLAISIGREDTVLGLSGWPGRARP
jgi:hypothetical protein